MAGSAALYYPQPASEGPTVSFLVRQTSGWTFTQGLLVGQASIVLVAVLFLRYVVFENAEAALEKDRIRRLKGVQRLRRRHARSSSASKGSAGAASPTSTPASSPYPHILQKTGYDISVHAPEPTDWLNVLLAQAIVGYREDVLAGGADFVAGDGGVGEGLEGGADDGVGEEKPRGAKELMEEVLNRKTEKGIDFLDRITVTDADFGDEYPIFSNARIRPADDTGRMRVEVDIDYNDKITLAVETKLLINYPRPRFATLPISLSLTLVRFSGTVAIELFSDTVSPHVDPSTFSSRSRHHMHFSLHPDFALDIHASSLIGSRAKLQDIPKIEQLVVSRIRGWVMDRLVWPRYWTLGLPKLVPSMADGERRARAEREMEIGMGPEEGEEEERSGAAGTQRRGFVPGGEEEEVVRQRLARAAAGLESTGRFGGPPDRLDGSSDLSSSSSAPLDRSSPRDVGGREKEGLEAHRDAANAAGGGEEEDAGPQLPGSLAGGIEAWSRSVGRATTSSRPYSPPSPGSMGGGGGGGRSSAPPPAAGLRQRALHAGVPRAASAVR